MIDHFTLQILIVGEELEFYHEINYFPKILSSPGRL